MGWNLFHLYVASGAPGTEQIRPGSARSMGIAGGLDAPPALARAMLLGVCHGPEPRKESRLEGSNINNLP